MRIDLRVDRGLLRRWHEALAERLARRPGTEIGFRLETNSRPRSSVNTLLQFEKLLYGLTPGGASDAIGAGALARFAPAAAAELTIDLAREPLPQNARVWRVECDGAALDDGLVAAAMAGRAPWLSVRGPEGLLAQARAGAEHAGVVRTCFEETLARVATLIEAALDGAALATPYATPHTADFDAAALSPARTLRRAARMISNGGKRAVYRALFNAPHWRVGWRRGEPDGLCAGVGAGWSELPDDGRRFYADPFPIVRDGRTFLFVEEFEHKLGKGVISAVEFGPNGPLGTPRVALERPVHLSYPQVFMRDGETWMIPESCGAGTIDLYRAREFPFSWSLERTLVEGVVASDATLVEHGGRWWMFASVQDRGGAFSDALCLWSAPDFRGPWTAHARNPVLIDIASARPAGAMFHRDGTLWRPVQDCRAGYGAALGFARVDRLDEDGFSQTVERVLQPGEHWPGRRLHTYNAGGGFEFIDGSALAPRWPALRAPLRRALRR